MENHWKTRNRKCYKIKYLLKRNHLQDPPASSAETVLGCIGTSGSFGRSEAFSFSTWSMLSIFMSSQLSSSGRKIVSKKFKLNLKKTPNLSYLDNTKVKFGINSKIQLIWKLFNMTFKIIIEFLRFFVILEKLYVRIF